MMLQQDGYIVLSHVRNRKLTIVGTITVHVWHINTVTICKNLWNSCMLILPQFTSDMKTWNS